MVRISAIRPWAILTAGPAGRVAIVSEVMSVS
jgi:hypothetical protein